MQVAARLLRPPRHCSPCCSPHPASGAAVVTGAKRLRLLCTAGTDATIEDALPAVQPPTHDSVWPTAPGSTHLAPAPDAVDIASPSLTPPTGASSPAPPAAGSGASAGGILGSGTAETRGPAYWELLSSPEVEVLSRAKSASDASVLRRKGHLKEQDLFIDFIRRMHETHTCEEVMSKVERWITEHRQDPRRSRLRRMVPTIGNFFTPLKLVDAFREYDSFFALSRRKFIPPNFAELRHILNIAQVHASADTLRLITFDADGTLYADGHHMQHDNEMIALIISLMRSGIHVAIVTAAGYPGDTGKFEARVAGLLQAFQALRLPEEITSRFHLMGGECNYLLRVRPQEMRLEFVPEHEWRTPEMLSWREADMQAMLDEAQTILVEGAARLRLPVTVLRKPRAVGVIPTAPTIYEVLEELAITVQHHMTSARVPFCAFNGGNDVFVDVGNKSLGLDSLMRYLHFSTHEVLHVGDRFTQSGNDSATRDCSAILWVANPEETSWFIKTLLKDVRAKRSQPYIE